MARKLTKKQQGLIENIVNKRAITAIEELTMEEYKELEKLNKYETLWQDTNRYIHDYRWSPKYEKKKY